VLINKKPLQGSRNGWQKKESSKRKISFFILSLLSLASYSIQPMKNLFILLFVGYSVLSSAQTNLFQGAYSNYPQLPKGILEAVSWSNTRMVHLSEPMESCSGMPAAYGIMGLFDDGKGYFLENGVLVAQLSGISVEAQKGSPSMQILGYAAAYESIRSELELPANSVETIREVLHQLSEIPDTGYVNFLAREMQVYQVLKFMNSSEMAQLYGFNVYHFDLEDLFGSDNYAVLSSKKINFTTTGIRSETNELFSITADKSLQYGPAIWNPAPSCNFSSRNGVAISAITIHTIQGTYSSAISWSQNCASNVSFHYVIRSSDGQVTQMVLEQDKGWHVGSENPYTIGYEHEGYVDNPIWYTEAMYNSSADLSKDIINSGYGIPALRTFFGDATVGINTLGGCTKIKGHQHYPNQSHTDPGINWDWEKYYKLINDTYTPTVITNPSGTITDNGGSGNYSDDERSFWLIQPANVSSITLDFNSFALEVDYDYLFIYDGNDVDAPLIGKYTGTNSPGIVSSSANSLLLEFRSDCSTTDLGWVAIYTSIANDNTAPVTSIDAGSNWKTDDFIVSFTDDDGQGTISDRYFLTAQNALSPDDWFGNNGFVYEDFEHGDSRWTNVIGTYTASNGKFDFLDESIQNSNAFIDATQGLGSSYLYTWKQAFTSTGTNKRAGLHFFCSDPMLTNRGNSYFVFLREDDDEIHLYRVENDVFTLVQDVPFVLTQGTTYDVATAYDPASGLIKVYIDGEPIISWQDTTPHTSGVAISLRTGGCEAQFDDVRMYRSRSTSVAISAGLGDEMEYESLGASPTGRILALSIDDADNISPIAIENVLLDFTAPEIDWLNDGSGNDIDTFYTSDLDANWQAFDPHSSISEYQYAIGILPDLDNVVSWTNVSLDQAISEALIAPIHDQVYHLSLKVTNGAGLTDQFMSNGQRHIGNLGLVDAEQLNNILLYPNPVTDEIYLKGLSQSVQYSIYDLNGKIVQSGSTIGKISVKDLASGSYRLVLLSTDKFIVKEFLRK
jgi:hypothetical protein